MLYLATQAGVTEGKSMGRPNWKQGKASGVQTGSRDRTSSELARHNSGWGKARVQKKGGGASKTYSVSRGAGARD